MFFKQLRIVAVPVLVLFLMVLLFGLPLRVVGVPDFDFLWNVVLGALLGCVLCLLPLLSGSNAARDRFAAQWWLACGLILFAIVYQYLCAAGGAFWPALRWLRTTHMRTLFGEGVLLGYVFVSAIRARK